MFTTLKMSDRMLPFSAREGLWEGDVIGGLNSSNIHFKECMRSPPWHISKLSLKLGVKQENLFSYNA